MYRSGTTIVARSLAGEKNIAFASDAIRPFFNHYRTKIQKKIFKKSSVVENDRPLEDYFNSGNKYLEYLLNSNFKESVSKKELLAIRNQVIEHSSIYSPKFKKVRKLIKFKFIKLFR